MNKKLTILIPTYREGKIIDTSIEDINRTLKKEEIDFEIIVIDDNSNDQTIEKINQISKTNKHIRVVLNSSSKGFGNSIIEGIKRANGEIICFVMADQSDSPKDIINYYNEIVLNDFDCVFGDRWIKKDLVENYPKFKFYINRFGNNVLSSFFNIKYTDLTNSFKMYKKSVLLELFPLISHHFSITVEIPLKAISRGYSYKIIPNKWKNNIHTVSNLNLRHVFVTYSLIIIYCLIEKYFFIKKHN